MESEKLYVCVFSVEATEVLNNKRNRNENIIIGMSMHTLLSLRVAAWSIVAIVCVQSKRQSSLEVGYCVHMQSFVLPGQLHDSSTSEVFCSLIPRVFLTPVFDHLQYAKTEENVWEIYSCAMKSGI